MIKRAMIAGHRRDRRVGRGPARRDQRGQPLRGRRTRPRPGGIHVQISDRDPERIQIMFFEANGILATDATRKDIEKYFNRQELRRALMNQLGELAFPPRVNEAYVAELLAQHRRRARSAPARFRIAARLRVLERRARDAGPAALAAGRVVLDPLVHGPRRAGDPVRRPARLHDPDTRGWWRRWGRTSGSSSTAPPSGSS